MIDKASLSKGSLQRKNFQVLQEREPQHIKECLSGASKDIGIRWIQSDMSEAENPGIGR